jgi:hypothetical protein
MLDHDIFPLFGRQVGDGEREGTQAVETDDPALIVDGDENTRHIAFLVLPGTKMEPIIERSQPARECRAVMLAERLDRFDHARSTEKIAMTFQCFDCIIRNVVRRYTPKLWVRTPEGAFRRARF